MGRGILIYSSKLIINLGFSGVKLMNRFKLCPPDQSTPVSGNSFVWMSVSLPRSIILCTLFVLLSLADAKLCLAQTTTNPNVDAQLLVAARKNNLEGVKQALSRGADANSRNRLGKTALMMAAENGWTALAELMVNAKTNVNLASLDRVTPLMAASYVGDAKIVTLLLATGADPKPLDRMTKSAMIYAAGQGHTETVKLLLDSGVSVDAAPVDGLTPLMWAAGQGHRETVALLLSRGANRDLKDDRKLTALDIARAQKQVAVAAVLAAP